MNILWVDVETTGLDKRRHGIIQIAGMVDAGGEIIETFDLRMNPEAEVDPAAQAIHGITPEEITSYPSRQETFDRFIAILARHVNPEDPTTLLHLAGYNVWFDFGFLEQWFLQMGGPPLGSYLRRRRVDPSTMMKACQEYLGKQRMPSWSLRAVAGQMGIPFGERHDALEDITLTREIHRRILALFAAGSNQGANGSA